MKNVYYKFVTTNIDLFLSAYIDQDYKTLNRSFYSVSVSITVIDTIKSHLLPFVLFYYRRWLLKSHGGKREGVWWVAKARMRDTIREKIKKIVVNQKGEGYRELKEGEIPLPFPKDEVEVLPEPTT